MAQRNYLVSTTALSLTASGSTAGSGNTTSGTFAVARSLVRTGLGAGELLSGSQTWAVHYVVSAMTTPYEMRLKVQRLNSSGVMQAESGYGTTRSATGTYDDNITADLGTWAANDQLALVWEHRRPSGTGSKNGTIDANGASYIDAPAPADPNITMALTGVDSTASVGTLSPATVNAFTGNEGIGAAGSLTRLVEERFVFDTCTNTDGTTFASHIPEVGGTISLHPNFTDTMSIQSNRVGKDSGTVTSVYYYSATPPRLEYTIEGDVTDVGNVNRAAGIGGWISTSADNGIYFRRQTASVWQFLKVIGVSVTSLETVATAFNLNAVARLKVVREGDLFYCYIDNVLTPGSPHTISDSEFQSVGKVGYRASNIHTATGYHIDNFSAYAVVAPDPNITLSLTGVSATANIGSVSQTGTAALTGVSATTSIGTLTTGATPAAPSALVLTAISSHEVMLVWTDNASNELTFRVERKTEAGGTYAEIGSTTKNLISFYDATVAANTTYFYRVRARNASGDSAYLTEQSVTTPLSGSTVSIMTANVQHGQKTDNSFDYGTQVSAMAGADIVCVQERSTTETGWNSPMSAAGLSQVVFKAHWGSPGDGNAIWVTDDITVLDTYTFDMANGVNPTSGSSVFGWNGTTDIRRSLCAIKAQVGSKQFYVICLHLVSASGEDSNNTNFASQRVDQINSALGWAASTLTGGLPRFIAGDINLPPNYPRAPERTYTVNIGTDATLFNSTGHGFTDGMAVVLRTTGAQPAPLAVGDSLYAQATVYYIRDATADTFKLAATRGGAAITLTSNGSGSNFVCATQWSLFWEAGYTDLWQDGINDGKASAPWGDRDENGTADMPLHFQLSISHDSRMIDRAFTNDPAGLPLRHITMPDHRAQCVSPLSGNTCPEVVALTGTSLDMGIRPSDHNFLEFVVDISLDVTVALDGVSVTSSVGSPNLSRTSSLTADGATTSAGSVVISAGVSITANVGATAIESLASSRSVEFSGALSSVSVGSLAITKSGEVALTGNAGTGAAGTLTVTSRSVALTANDAPADVGSLNFTESGSVSLTNVSVIGTAGSISPNTSLTISGNQATGSVDVVTPSQATAAILTGESAVMAIGTLTPQTTRSVTSNELATSVGSVTTSATGSVALSGNAATGTLGNVMQSRSVSLSGISVLQTAATLGVDRAISLTEATATGGVGSVGAEQEGTVALTGAQGVVSLGTFEISKSGSLSIDGVNAFGSLGDVAGYAGTTIAGTAVSGSAGTVSTSTSATVALGGTFVSVSQGLLGPIVAVGLGGVAATGAVGLVILPSPGTAAITGAGVVGLVGALTPRIFTPRGSERRTVVVPEGDRIINVSENARITIA